ncbi:MULTISPECIES: ABC transporter permease subunit [Pseudomonadota]|jgi:oligopeptide transport system permease protein|uniref:ABC transporter permease n=1 Tax=Pseudomonadota TaxID=1224 RepID=UPI00076A5022|nr:MULTISPECIES: ABC transporter permease subunit [Pseudomonadota]MAF61270.1 ABC transporter [Blastomonas sp.]|tara:strand:+ start:15742 stop:16671 length:930 start_codon:yes stop_codon:yes gene_type:complete
MRALILRRLLTAVPTLLLVLLASFALMRFAPGGPFDGERPLAPETRAALEAAYGLDLPMGEQFALFLKRTLTGDFGPSLVYRDFTVTQLIADSLPVSLTLGGLAIVLALALGLAAGTVAALRPGGWADETLMLAATIVTALPSFVTGPLLALVFGLWLGLLPVGGLGDGLLSAPQYWIMPVVALALPVAGAIAKLARAGLAAALAQEHVRTARARGLGTGAIIARHALRPALVPVVSYLGPAAAGLLTGAVVIETVFALPGLGRYFVQGALNRDYPLIMAVILLYAALIIAFNLLADLLYGWLDPRSRG